MMPQRYAQWKIASMYVTTRQDQRFADTSPRVEKNDNNIAITYTYFMPTTPQSSCEVTYRVFGDGTIETTLSYDPVKELGDMPEFGMMFKLDADYDTVKWYGLDHRRHMRTDSMAESMVYTRIKWQTTLPSISFRRRAATSAE